MSSGNIQNVHFPKFPPDHEPLTDFIQGFFDPFIYQPNAWVPTLHQDLELVLVCILNFFTLVLIITRTTIRRRAFGRFRKDDYWLMGAAILLICPFTVAQIGGNRRGEGLHDWNILPDDQNPLYQFEIGYHAYYIVVSMVKISVVYGFLEILPPVFTGLRITAYVLIGLIAALGISLACANIFQCQPFMSNFDPNVLSTECLPIQYAKFTWVGVSVLLDLIIVGIPFAMLRIMRLKKYERAVLMAVFGATLLGTFSVAGTFYTIFKNQDPFADNHYELANFIIMNSAEIFFYTIGTSATMASKYFISKAESYASRSKETSEQDQGQGISWPTSNNNFNISTPGYDPARDYEKSGPFAYNNQGFQTPPINTQRTYGYSPASSAGAPFSPYSYSYERTNSFGSQKPLVRHPGPAGGSGYMDMGGLARGDSGRDRPLPALPRNDSYGQISPRMQVPPSSQYFNMYHHYS